MSGGSAAIPRTNVALKNSCHSIAIHPTDPTLTIVCSGFRPPTARCGCSESTVRFPGSYIGNAERPGDGPASSPWMRVRDVKTSTSSCSGTATRRPRLRRQRRSLDERRDRGWATGPGSAAAGRCSPGTMTSVYGLTRLTGPERSTCAGRTIAARPTRVLAEYRLGRRCCRANFYYAVLAIHPTDPAIFFTASSTGDLARFDGNTGTWRTSYGMPAPAHRRRYPGRGEPRTSIRSRSTRRTPTSATSAWRALAIHGIWRSENIQAVSPDWEDITTNFHRINTGSEAGGASADRRRVRRQRRRRRGAGAAAAGQALAPVADRQLAGPLRSCDPRGAPPIQGRLTRVLPPAAPRRLDNPPPDP